MRSPLTVQREALVQGPVAVGCVFVSPKGYDEFGLVDEVVGDGFPCPAIEVVVDARHLKLDPSRRRCGGGPQRRGA